MLTSTENQSDLLNFQHRQGLNIIMAELFEKTEIIDLNVEFQKVSDAVLCLCEKRKFEYCKPQEVPLLIAGKQHHIMVYKLAKFASHSDLCLLIADLQTNCSFTHEKKFICKCDKCHKLIETLFCLNEQLRTTSLIITRLIQITVLLENIKLLLKLKGDFNEGLWKSILHGGDDVMILQFSSRIDTYFGNCYSVLHIKAAETLSIKLWEMGWNIISDWAQVEIAVLWGALFFHYYRYEAMSGFKKNLQMTPIAPPTVAKTRMI